MSFVPALVIYKRPLTHAVMAVSLRCEPEQLRFQPGQWLDVKMPGVAELGGFSICSSPKEFAERKQLLLAVKKSSAAPSLWVHDSCNAGDSVQLRVGGSCVLPATPPLRILLVAGGVGLTPLRSMLMYCLDLMVAENPTPKFVHLIHSVSSANDLLFVEDIREACGKMPNLTARWFISGDINDEEARLLDKIGNWRKGRIDHEHLRQIAIHLIYDSIVFLCGPPGMVQDVKETLVTAGVPADCIHSEDWSSSTD